MLNILLLVGLALSFPLEASNAAHLQGSGQLPTGSQSIATEPIPSASGLPLNKSLSKGNFEKSPEGSYDASELQYIKQDEVDSDAKRKEAIEHYKQVLEDIEDRRQRYAKEYEKTKPIVATGDYDEIYKHTGVPKYVGWNTKKNDEYFQGKDKEFESDISKIRRDLDILNRQTN